MMEDKKQDPASKLEQGYIQMFLGKLEPMQESRYKAWTSFLIVIYRIAL